jgi:hypothetical protein
MKPPPADAMPTMRAKQEGGAMDEEIDDSADQ